MRFFFLLIALLWLSSQQSLAVDYLSQERPNPEAAGATGPKAVGATGPEAAGAAGPRAANSSEADVSSSINPIPRMQDDLEKYFLRTTAYSGARLVEARKLLIAQHRNLFRRAIGTVSPLRWGKEVQRAYTQHEFLAMNYGKHEKTKSAIAASIKPTTLGNNLKASLKAWRHPAAYVGYALAPLVLEGHRQLKYEGKLDNDKLKETVEPLPLAGAIGGAFSGDLAGATVQSALGSFGMLGHVAGFVARPMICFTGYHIGNNFGKTAQQGKPSFKQALADTMHQINPMQFTTAVACGSLGGVIGQALIPIPVIGYIAGYALGGTFGTTLGTALGKYGPTGKWNEAITSWLKRQGDKLVSRREASIKN